MSNPFCNLPEIRASFETDANKLLQAAAIQLVELSQPATDFAAAADFRKSIHSLRGAAAMIGAADLTRLVDDYERLAEIADSFKLTARDQATAAYAFLHQQLENVGKCVQATLRIEPQEAKQKYDNFHAEILHRWGDYFYRPAPETDERSHANLKPEAKPARTARGPRRSDPHSVAHDFLTSIGMAPSGGSRSAPIPKEQIDPEMLSYFVLETQESLAQLETLVLDWEKQPNDPQIAQSLFRLAHTMKGAANSLGLSQIGGLLHVLEDVLESHVIDRSFPELTKLVELILSVSDTVKALVQETQRGVANPKTAARAAAVVQRLQAILSTPPPPLRAPATPQFGPTPSTDTPGVLPKPAAAAGPDSGPESEASTADLSEHQTIRVDSERLDLLMNLIGELVISRSRIEKKLNDIARLKDEMSFGKSRLFQAITDFQGKYEYSTPAGGDPARKTPGPVRTATAADRRPPNQGSGDEALGFSALEFDQYDDFNILARTLMEIGTDTGEIFSQLNRFFDSFGEETGQFSKITARLQDEITRVRMMPLTLLFHRLERAARDAARKEAKQVDFVTLDNDAKLDKLILDKLYAPLLHIVRNAVAHGIESPEQRQTLGKHEAGRIQLKASCEANAVIIEVSDDGGGLNLDSIRATAIQRGLINESTDVDAETLTQFIFHPGFSTASSVTDVSGRGVGLDVVRQEISRLSGSVQVRSTPGQGCVFIIQLPLTLAINQAMFIAAGQQTFALPLNFVERIQADAGNEIVQSGQSELLRTPHGTVPLVRMTRLLALPADQANAGAIVLARVADRRIAIQVDRILRKQDIVVKPLGPLLRGHPLFSGATLGGDGQMAMIVDLPRLFEQEQGLVLSALNSTAPAAAATPAEHPSTPAILVVDDSLSVRKVLEKHLLHLKYKVELAVDGLDALEKLRTCAYALVLTDLEMPRMHGLELIAEMRRHQQFRSIPVIVVTSRDAEKHRKQAAAAGANDYIIKPFSREQLAKHINQHLSKRSK